MMTARGECASIVSTPVKTMDASLEAFTEWKNLRGVLIFLFGATAGQGVIWYTGQFYALFYLQTILKVHATSANYIIAAALLLGMPLFVVMGSLSDRFGRKRLMRIRCTALSLPYHIGNGVFGGMLPLIRLSIVARTGNIYAGLYYPIGVALVTFVVGSWFMKETHQHKMWDEVD